MRAAESLFARRRRHEIALDDVVRQARVGKGTICRYCQDKDDLLFGTATRGFDELCEPLTREVPADAPELSRPVEMGVELLCHGAGEADRGPLRGRGRGRSGSGLLRRARERIRPQHENV